MTQFSNVENAARRAPRSSAQYRQAGVATAENVLQRAVAPPTLSRVLAAGSTEHEDAWAEFVAAHSKILLHTCSSLARDPDAAMDGYVYVLEALRGNDYRRLRAYVPDDKTRFTTWLVLVTRRLLLDHYRERYGRSRSHDDARRAEHVLRRRLEDLVASEVDPDHLTSSNVDSPDARLQKEELARALRVAINELQPSDRLLLALRFEDDRSVREIATVLGLPTVFHVYRRLGVVVATLRRSLARHGVEGSEP